MKTKKFLILSVLIVITLMLLTGCNYDVTTESKTALKMAKEFLSTKGYEIPKGYTINYVDENKTQLCISSNKAEVLLDISEGNPQIISIKDSPKRVITRNQIDEIKEVATNFLNTKEYQKPEKCKEIKYVGKHKKQLKVTMLYESESKDAEDMEITITFDITDDELKVEEIAYYIKEYNIGAAIIVLIIYFLAVVLIAIVTSIGNIKIEV